MDGAGWKHLIMYIVMICVEICTIYFFYPETKGRTLEELAFCKYAGGLFVNWLLT